MDASVGRGPGVRWFALGVALTSATQLRPGGLPVGMGELLLLSWSAVVLALVLWNGRVHLAEPLRPFASFWFLAYLFLFLGWTQSTFRGLASKHGPYDALAFTFVGIIMAAVILWPRASEGVSAAGGIVLASVVLPFFLLLLVVLAGTFQVGPVVLWKGRFMGWAVNPNQVSLAVAPVPFLLMYKMGRAPTHGRRLVYGGLLVCAFLVGVASLSDALNLAWVGSLGVIAVLLWLRAVARPSLGYWTGVLVYALVPLAMILAALAIGYPMLMAAMDAAESVYGAGDQGSVRVTLWKNGLRALAASPLVGNGPGAFAGLFAPFTNGEAHNTFIDWAASTGILGVVLLLVLLGGVLRRAWRSGHTTLVAAVVSLAFFSIFHYVLRQPLFWFYLVFVAVEAQKAVAARGTAPAGGRGIVPVRT